MKRVGPHVPTVGGVFNAPINAHKLGAKAFALFTKNQRQWTAKPYSAQTIDSFAKNLETYGFEPRHILPHNSYLVNLGSPDPDARKKSIDSLIDEINRCQQLQLLYINAHPGNAMDSSVDQCIAHISESLNICLNSTKEISILLENTAGQGSSVGHTFEHLAAIIDKVEDKNRIGICFDTAHAFAAGYQIQMKQSFEKTMSRLDAVVGLKYLKAIHLNDSKAKFNSKIDRHHSLGKGLIGIEVFSCIMNDPRFDEMPLILETIDENLWRDEIALLYNLIKKRTPNQNQAPVE